MKASVLRRFTVSLVILACLCFTVDRVASLVLDHAVKQSGLRFSKLYAGEANANILVLGNSRAVNAFYAPDLEEVLDQSVFHLGYNGMSMELCEVIFLDYLDDNAKPELVVLEVTNLRVSNDLLKDLKLYAGLSQRLRSLIQRVDPQLNRICSVTQLYRYNCELFLRSLFYWGQSDQAWINSGNIDPAYAESFVPAEEDQSSNLYSTAGANWDALQRMIEKCASQGIELRLVASPYLPAFRNNLHAYNAWSAAFRAALADPKLFYDYTQSLNDPAYFADVLHINRKGSRALLDIMINDKVFKVEQP